MSTRTKSQTVTFKRPFRVRGADRELPAGDYEIETDEESIDGLPTLSYRRVEVRLFVPRREGVAEAEMWVLGVREFDAARLADEALPAPPLPDSRPIGETVPVSPGAETSAKRTRAPSRPKGENAPLYGTLLGVLALMIAGVVLGRMDLASRPAQGSVMQVTDTRE